ncbi:hypothetical protein BKA69DRAFT_1125736 [Paraphysoderma sedebokerense]|nr:hypothetical protein BKA69DRAFT_1125736 [Paraphysoderma sedebokerense]
MRPIIVSLLLMSLIFSSSGAPQTITDTIAAPEIVNEVDVTGIQTVPEAILPAPETIPQDELATPQITTQPDSAVPQISSTIDSAAPQIAPVIGTAAPPTINETLLRAAVPRLVYVWTGPADTTKNDYLAVINLNSVKQPKARNNTLTMPIEGIFDVPTKKNEPHHMGISADGKTLAVGGLFSVKNNVDDAYFFNISSNPRAPKLFKADRPTTAGYTDEFVALPDGGFMVSYVSNPNPPTDGFNPHGCVVDFQNNLIATADFIDPATKAARNTIRIWDATTMEITKTFQGPLTIGGFMSVALNQGFVYATAMGEGKLYLADPKSDNLTMSAVYDFGAISMPQTVLTYNGGQRALVSLYGLDAVDVLNTADPLNPTLIQRIQLPQGAGPHVIKLSKDGSTLAVSCYFRAANPGDSTVRFFNVNGDNFTPHPVFPVVDFKTAVPDKGFSRPHGVAFHF